MSRVDPSVTPARSHRPTRRALLLGGVITATGVMAACDDSESPMEETPRPRTEVSFQELTTAEELQTTDRVVRGTCGVSATDDHELSVMLWTENLLQSTLQCFPVGGGNAVEVPIEPGAADLSISEVEGTVHVLEGRVADGVRTYYLHTSSNLIEGATAEVTGSLTRDIWSHDSGLVAEEPLDGEVPLWALSQDGSASRIGVLQPPVEQDWSIQSLARDGDIVLVLIAADLPDEGRTTALVVSQDGGATWSEPTPITSSGDSPWATDIAVLDGTFLVLGTHSTEGYRQDQERPVAWSTVDGTDPTEEEIPCRSGALRATRSRRQVDSSTRTSRSTTRTSTSEASA